MTADEVKNLLKIYYDIPQMIDEEFAVIRHCEAEKNRIALPSVNLSGMPGGKGLPGDRTASMAMANQARYYDDEIKACSRRIAELREKRDWLRTALDTLDRIDRQILELAYIGPSDPERRRGWRPQPWRQIAQKMNYSRNGVKRKAYSALFRLSEVPFIS